MRWLWRNIKKTRFLYVSWILRVTIAKRWGPLALFLSALFWFMIPIYLFNAMARYGNSQIQYMKKMQETQVGFWTIFILGGSVFAYLIFRLNFWRHIVTNMAYGSNDSAQEALENYESKLENLDHA